MIEPPSWGPWGEWDDCTASCDGGTQQRERECMDSPCPDGTTCSGESSEAMPCNEDPCPGCPPEAVVEWNSANDPFTVTIEGPSAGTWKYFYNVLLWHSLNNF